MYDLETHRRLAVRADAVARRHAKDSPFIAALAPSVEARSLAFIEEYERLRTRGNPRAALIAVQLALAKDVRGWLTLVAYHVTDVDRGKFTGNPEVPEDLVGDAERLIEIVDRHEAEHGPLHFGEQLRANLTADIAAVRDRHDDHGGAVTDETATRRALNDAAGELRRVIAALRSAMKLALGADHPATRSLRVRTRGAKADEEVAADDSPNSEQPDVVVPAE